MLIANLYCILLVGVVIVWAVSLESLERCASRALTHAFVFFLLFAPSADSFVLVDRLLHPSREHVVQQVAPRLSDTFAM